LSKSLGGDQLAQAVADCLLHILFQPVQLDKTAHNSGNIVAFPDYNLALLPRSHHNGQTAQDLALSVFLQIVVGCIQGAS
jgi:hypothetical protein